MQQGYFRFHILLLLFFCTVATSKSPSASELGMNLAAVVDWGSQLPFLDLAKQSREWVAQKTGAPWGKGGELELTEDGWVARLKPGQHADLIFLTLRGNPLYSHYRVTYDGEGEIRYMLAADLHKRDRSNNTDHITVRYKQDSGVTYAVLRIVNTNVRNPIRNIRIVPSRYVELHDNGEHFNPDWLRIIRNFKVIRYMDWMKTNNSRLEKWSDRPLPGDRSWSPKGVPVEIMVALSNRTKSSPWFTMPHRATDEYIQKFAQFVRDNLDSDLKVYVEYSNEVWNRMFTQFSYAQERAFEFFGNREAVLQWYGLRAGQICEVWKRIFAKQAHRVQCIVSTHTFAMGRERQILECPLWQKTSSKRCIDLGIDALAITGYFSGCLHGMTNNPSGNKIELIRSWAWAGRKGLDLAFKQLQSGSEFACFDTLLETKKRYEYYKRVADQYGIQLHVYEGGSHITGLGTPIQRDAKVFEFLHKVNRDSRIFDAYMKNFHNWKNINGSLFMHYLDVQPAGYSGIFGALESLNDLDAPKYKALLEFMKENNRFPPQTLNSP